MTVLLESETLPISSVTEHDTVFPLSVFVIELTASVLPCFVPLVDQLYCKSVTRYIGCRLATDEHENTLSLPTNGCLSYVIFGTFGFSEI